MRSRIAPALGAGDQRARARPRGPRPTSALQVVQVGSRSSARGRPRRRAREQLAQQPARCSRSHGTPVNCTAWVTSWSATQRAARRVGARGPGGLREVRRDEQQPRRAPSGRAGRARTGRARAGRGSPSRPPTSTARRSPPTARARAGQRPEPPPERGRRAARAAAHASRGSRRSTRRGRRTPAAAARRAAPGRCTRRSALARRSAQLARATSARPRPAIRPAPRRRAARSARARRQSIISRRRHALAAARRAPRARARGDDRRVRARGPAARRAGRRRAGKATRPPASRTMSCAAAASTARQRHSVAMPSTRAAATWHSETAIEPMRADAVGVLDERVGGARPASAGRRTRGDELQAPVGLAALGRRGRERAAVEAGAPRRAARTTPRPAPKS